MDVRSPAGLALSPVVLTSAKCQHTAILSWGPLGFVGAFGLGANGGANQQYAAGNTFDNSGGRGWMAIHLGREGVSDC